MDIAHKGIGKIIVYCVLGVIGLTVLIFGALKGFKALKERECKCASS